GYKRKFNPRVAAPWPLDDEPKMRRAGGLNPPCPRFIPAPRGRPPDPLNDARVKIWQPEMDSNHRYQLSESCVLPLDDPASLRLTGWEGQTRTAYQASKTHVLPLDDPSE